jgi:hypothetical protein
MSEKVNFIYESPIATRCMNKLAAKSPNPARNLNTIWRMNWFDNNLSLSEYWEDFGLLTKESLRWFVGYVKNMVKREKKTGETAPLYGWVALEADGYYERNNL